MAQPSVNEREVGAESFCESAWKLSLLSIGYYLSQIALSTTYYVIHGKKHGWALHIPNFIISPLKVPFLTLYQLFSPSQEAQIDCVVARTLVIYSRAVILLINHGWLDNFIQCDF
jgi:hypothetical protein